jgi:transcriptional regulator with XRE-family HTH domain
MNEAIRDIAKRLQGLRDALDLTTGEIARQCGISLEEYEKAESGEHDISISMVQTIAKQYSIPLEALLFGEDPKVNAYFVTRSGKGISIERTKAYKYQSLAAGFINRKADPFLVTVAPKDPQTPLTYNSHEGQEFDLILKGRMRLVINEKEVILEQGDSIYFDSKLPHAMETLDGETTQFLAVIL